MANPQLLTIGETMALVTPTTAEPLESATYFTIDAAGAESNVASHCAQLGVGSMWVSALGQDPLGRRVIAAINQRGVDTSHVITIPHAPTGVYFKDPGKGVHYYRQNSAASSMPISILDDLPFAEASILHLTGITPALSEACAGIVDQAITKAESFSLPFSFDINYRQALWPASTAGPRLLEIGKRANIVFVGLDEAHDLWGCTTPQEVRSLLPSPTLVVKNSDIGATEFDGADKVFVPAPRVDVVEVVGAGDAFAAGYIAAFLQGKDAAQRLQAGHERAGLVLQTTSDFMPRTGET